MIDIERIKPYFNIGWKLIPVFQFLIGRLKTWQIQSETGWVVLSREQIAELGLSKDQFRRN